MSEYNQSDCFDWNDEIENDGQEFVILPEGDYVFTVEGFERGYFNGSAKIPACNKAILTLGVETPDGTAHCRSDLILFRSLEWKISAFFRSIGMKKHGERLVMDWAHVIGKQGRAHFKPRKYTDQNGTERLANDLDKYYDYDPAKMESEIRNQKSEIRNPEFENDEDIPF